MAIRSITILKSWFKKGMYPTESQFGDWLDSFFHRDDKIPVASIDGLDNAINSKAEQSAIDTLSQSVSAISNKADGANITAASAREDAKQALTDAGAAQQSISSVKDTIPYRFGMYYKRSSMRPDKPSVTNEDGLSGSWVSTPEDTTGSFPLWVIYCWWSSTAINGTYLRMIEGPFLTLEEITSNNNLSNEEKMKLAQLSGVNTGDQDLSGLQTLIEKNQANGYAGLDDMGKVPAALLPSYVDDVLEYANYSSLPVSGEAGKIYITTDDNKQYRWSGSTYVNIAASPGTTDAVTEGVTNLYYTESRVRNTVLAGVSFLVNQAVSATDTVLGALGKLQAQLTALVNGKVDKNGTDTLMTQVERTKLSSIADSANNYVHPTTHPASIIEQDSTHQFVTADEKTSYANKLDKTLSKDKIFIGDSGNKASEIDTIPIVSQALAYDGQLWKDDFELAINTGNSTIAKLPCFLSLNTSTAQNGVFQLALGTGRTLLLTSAMLVTTSIGGVSGGDSIVVEVCTNSDGSGVIANFNYSYSLTPKYFEATVSNKLVTLTNGVYLKVSGRSSSTLFNYITVILQGCYV